MTSTTKNNHSKEEVAPSKIELDMFFEHSLDIMILIGFDNRIKQVNPSFERILGWKKEEVISKPFYDFLHTDDLEKSNAEAKAHEEGKNAVNFENRYRCKDGSYRWISWNSHPIPEKQVVIGIGRDITEQKKTEEALKQSEERFSKSFSSNPVALSISKLADGLLIDVNETYLQLFGFNRQEVIGHTSTELNVFSNPSQREKLINRLVDESSVRNLEVDFKTKTGKLINVILSMEKLHSIDQDYLLSTFIDVTERKKAEQALQLSEAKYRQIIEVAEEGIWMAKTDGETLFVNPKMANMLGYSQEYFIGKVGTDFLVKGQEKTVAQSRKDLYNNKKIQNEYQFLHKNGTTIWTIGKTTPFFDEKGQHVANLSMHTEITERKKAEEELRKNEQLYRTVFDNSQDGFQLIQLVYDKKGKPIDHTFLKVNHAYETIIGVKAEDIIDKTAKYISPNQEPHWLEVPDRVAKTGKSEHVELYNKDINKTLDCFYFRYSPNVVGTLFRDITERKNMEKQLQEKERMATIGATAGMVGHDLRNPLQSITSEIYLVESELKEMPNGQQKVNVQESLDNISEQVTYMNKIVSDLQDFVRPVKAQKQTVNLNQLITSTLAQIVVPKEVQTSVEVKDNLSVETDPQLLKRVLINLITNALQAMPKGGDLTVRTYINGEGQIRIEVQDTGVGIPEEIKPKLFQPLFTTKSKGQGFGLAVCKRVIEAQGGTITFESEVGKGTKFTVKLPKNKDS